MMWRRIVTLLAIVSTGTLAHADPTIYFGSLSSEDGGLVGTGGWVNTPEEAVTFTWTVSQNADLSWHYHYVFDSTGLQGNLGHLLLETGLDVTAGDILNATPAITAGDPRLHSSANGNPSLPEPLFSIKFQPFDGSIATIDFDSPLAPTWGDFYAKGGAKSGHLWNAGFTVSDTDPLEAAANGSLDHHVLVPFASGSITAQDVGPAPQTGAIPAPGALVLASLGAGLLSWLRTRRVI